MNDLIVSEFVKTEGKQVKTTTMVIAEKFGKEHRDVLKAIRNLDCSEDFGLRNFALSNYVNSQGKEQPCYELTRDGFMFLAMGFTGPQAAH